MNNNTLLKDVINIPDSFLRAVRLDSDKATEAALNGFVLTESHCAVIQEMADNIQSAKAHNSAFTLTGNYGVGKSSLLLFLTALLDSESGRVNPIRRFVKDKLEKTSLNYNQLMTAFYNGRSANSDERKAKKIVSITGTDENPLKMIHTALVLHNVISVGTELSTVAVIQALQEFVKSDSEYNGVVLIFDEMGKTLDFTIRNNSDIHVFQDLADFASRSNGKFILIGVLHQDIIQYAGKNKIAVDEWNKVKGRFANITLAPSAYEQIDLVSQAIHTNEKLNVNKKSVQLISADLAAKSGSSQNYFEKKLERCAPLHPAVVCLLGALSRKGYGQNQRSIFNFLRTVEPNGFSTFINTNTIDKTFNVYDLFDYIKSAFDSYISSSPDKLSWLTILEAIDIVKREAKDELYIQIIKSVGLLGLLQDSSPIRASKEVIYSIFPDILTEELDAILVKMSKLSTIKYLSFAKTYAIFAGSDFDLDQELKEAVSSDTGSLRVFDSTIFKPVMASRHYYQTGAARWMDIHFTDNVKELCTKLHTEQAKYQEHSVYGHFILDMGTVIQDYTQYTSSYTNIAIAKMESVGAIFEIAARIDKLTSILETNTALQYDSTAKRYIASEIQDSLNQLDSLLYGVLDSISGWEYCGNLGGNRQNLSETASDIMAGIYQKTPNVFNELVYRSPPSNAIQGFIDKNIKGIFKLIGRRTAALVDAEVLGFTANSAEGGLFRSVFCAMGFYAKAGEEHGEHYYQITQVAKVLEDNSNNIRETVQYVLAILKNSNGRVSLQDIKNKLIQPPYGLKEGVIPFIIAYIIAAERKHISVYCNGIFSTELTEDISLYIVKQPQRIELRWVEYDSTLDGLLKMIASAIGMPVTDSGTFTTLEVSRGLVAAHRKLPQWSRTTHNEDFLTKNAIALNNILTIENDPDRLVEDDLPRHFSKGDSVINTENAGRIGTQVVEAFKEIQNAYADLLAKLKEKFEHRISLSPNKKNLKTRAKAIQDFGFSFRDDAFIKHIINYYGKPEFYEKIMGFAASKPVDRWSDNDLKNAFKNLYALIESFETAERLVSISEQTEGLKTALNKKEDLHNLLLLAGPKSYNLVDIDTITVLDDTTITSIRTLQAKIGVLLSKYE